MSAAPLRLALAGGGTGGHVVPGLAVAAALAARGRLADVLWLGAGRRAEERSLAGLAEAVGGAPARVVRLALEPEGGGAPGTGRMLLRTPADLLRARRALVGHGSEVLLGLGGVTSLPAVLAARTAGVMCALLEVNATQGRATRTLGRFARVVMHAWGSSVPHAGEGRHRVVGPVVGAAFAPAPPQAAVAARASLGFEAGRPLLVVLGGSQGAGALNTFVRERVAILLGAGVQVLHQTGPGRLDEAARPAPGYRSEEYVDAATALTAATLVLCRGGAATLAELAVMGRPAVVVPYPHHPDRHQTRNAAELAGGVRVVEEERLGADTAVELARLVGDAGAPEREAMAAALLERVPTGGAERVAGALLELLDT